MLKVNHTYLYENVVSIDLNGNLDISTVFLLEEEMKKIKKADQIIIDFSELTFIDSTGIGAILEMIFYARQNECLVDFKGLNDYIREVFETVGVIRVLERYSKVQLGH